MKGRFVALLISVSLGIIACSNSFSPEESGSNGVEESIGSSSNIASEERCAVLGFKAGTGVSVSSLNGISEIFSTYFRPVGYTMVERTQIDKVITEQSFQRSDLTQDQMVKVGEILNVSKIVLGVVTVLGGGYNVDVRVIDVQSGIDVASEGATFSGDYRTSMKNLAQKLAGKIPIAQEQPTEPYVVYGYLKVYPQDLGVFDAEPKTIIARLNQSQQFGYSSWRLPTNEEISLMRANNVIGSGTYMTKETRDQGGVVRLVSDMEKDEVLPVIPDGYVDLGLTSGTLWKENNEGTGYYTRDEAIKLFGNQIPTEEQWLELKTECQWNWNSEIGYKVTGSNGNFIILPYTGCRYHGGSVQKIHDGYYWTSTTVQIYISQVNYSRCLCYLCFSAQDVKIDKSQTIGYVVGCSIRLVQNK